eukprot:8980182-Heterocapsa_arctica.AAC.1
MAVCHCTPSLIAAAARLAAIARASCRRSGSARFGAKHELIVVGAVGGCRARGPPQDLAVVDPA